MSAKHIMRLCTVTLILVAFGSCASVVEGTGPLKSATVDRQLRFAPAKPAEKESSTSEHTVEEHIVGNRAIVRRRRDLDAAIERKVTETSESSSEERMNVTKLPPLLRSAAKEQEVRRRQRDIETSSEDRALGDKNVSSSESSSEELQRVRGMESVAAEQAHSTSHLQQRTIWQELKEGLNWTDAHIEKYKTFMNKLRAIRTEELRKQGIVSKDVEEKPMMINPEYNPELFEGDVLLSEEQLDVLQKIIDDANYTKKSDHELGIIASNLASRWTSPIRYTFESGVNVAAITAGVNKWQELTCIQFIRDDKWTGDRITFYNGGGCFSSVGKIPGNQKVSLGSGCEMLGTVCHEIAHALGVWHEQTRHDRDNYVTIDFNNIMTSAKGNYEKLLSNYMYHQEVPYDYGSAMHYSSRSFAVNRNVNAMVAKKSAYQTTMGQRNAPTFLDAKVLNLAYCRQCSGSCQNGGYVNPKSCQGCLCPEGFGGSQCERAASTGISCGTIDLDVQSGKKTISKSGTGTCYWVVKARAGMRVRATINKFNMFCESEVCNQAYMGMSLEQNIGQAIARICCRPSAPLVSYTNVVVLKYYSTRQAELSLTVEQV